MNINDIDIEQLKLILKEKKEELENFYKTDEYLWVKNNKNIEDVYYDSFIKYKLYFYKKIQVELYLNTMNDEINSLIEEIAHRNNFAHKKRIDN